MTDEEIKALFAKAKKDADDRTWVFMGVVCFVAPITWGVVWGIAYFVMQRALR